MASRYISQDGKWHSSCQSCLGKRHPPVLLPPWNAACLSKSPQAGADSLRAQKAQGRGSTPVLILEIYCSGDPGRVQVRARWINMREELNIYINGKPYVLREDERPFKNMQACPFLAL